MSSTSRYEISLRIWHPTLTRNRISEGLTRESHAGWNVGDPRKSIANLPITPHEHTYWTSRLTTGEVHPLNVALKEVCGTLQPYTEFLAEIRRTGGRAELFVGWFSTENLGETLSYLSLEAIANLGLDLALDIYSERDRGDQNSSEHS